MMQFCKKSALGGTRTHGLSLRRAALYPTELQAHEITSGLWFRVSAEGFQNYHRIIPSLKRLTQRCLIIHFSGIAEC